MQETISCDLRVDWSPMAFPEHYLLQWGGDFLSEPQEIWSNTLRFAMGTGTDPGALPSMTSAQQQTAAVACLAVLTDSVQDNASPMSPNVRIKFAKFNRIDDQGHYAAAGTTNAAFVDGPGTAGQHATPHPVTASLVVTWRTSASRGPASRGRIFVPQPGVTTAAPTHRIPPADVLAIAGFYRAQLIALRGAVTAAGGAGLKPCVVSQLGTNGVSLAIEKVEVGNFLDYMGSRRSNLTEVRQQSAALA